MKWDSHRAAWTAFVEGNQVKRSKFGNVRSGGYMSKKEERVAGELATLERFGKITELKEQVPFELIPKDGRLKAIKYVADFTYMDSGGLHVVDVKGGEATKTAVYRLKRRLMKHIHGITIEEV